MPQLTMNTLTIEFQSIHSRPQNERLTELARSRWREVQVDAPHPAQLTAYEEIAIRFVTRQPASPVDD